MGRQILLLIPGWLHTQFFETTLHILNNKPAQNLYPTLNCRSATRRFLIWSGAMLLK